MSMSMFIQVLGELQGMGEMQKGGRRDRCHIPDLVFGVIYVLVAATPPVISLVLCHPWLKPAH